MSVERKQTILTNIACTRLSTNASTGQTVAVVRTLFPDSSGVNQVSQNVTLDMETMQYLNEKGEALWPISPKVATDKASLAIELVNADLDAAAEAGVFDL